MFTAVYTGRAERNEKRSTVKYFLLLIVGYAIGCLLIKFCSGLFVFDLFESLYSAVCSSGFIKVFFTFLLTKAVIVLTALLSGYFCFGKALSYFILLCVSLFYGLSAGYMYSTYYGTGAILFFSTVLIPSVIVMPLLIHRLRDASSIATRLFCFAFSKESAPVKSITNKDFMIKLLITSGVFLVLSAVQAFAFKILIFIFW